MAMDAQQFIDNAEMLAPWFEKAAVLSGSKILASLASVLRRATENPSTKEQLIAWLRWTPIFTGDGTPVPEPSLPDGYSDLQAELVDVRVGCENCDCDPCPNE